MYYPFAEISELSCLYLLFSVALMKQFLGLFVSPWNRIRLHDFMQPLSLVWQVRVLILLVRLFTTIFLEFYHAIYAVVGVDCVIALPVKSDRDVTGSSEHDVTVKMYLVTSQSISACVDRLILMHICALIMIVMQINTGFLGC